MILYIISFLGIIILPFSPAFSYLFISLIFLFYTLFNDNYKVDSRTFWIALVLGIASIFALAAINLSPNLPSYYSDIGHYYENYLEAGIKENVICIYGNGKECLIPFYNYIVALIYPNLSLIDYAWFMLVPSIFSVLVIYYILVKYLQINPFSASFVLSTMSMKFFIVTPRSALSYCLLYLLLFQTLIFRKSLIKYLLLFFSVISHLTAPLYFLLYNLIIIFKRLPKFIFTKYYLTISIFILFILFFMNFGYLVNLYINSNASFLSDKLIYFYTVEQTDWQQNLKQNLVNFITFLSAVTPIYYINLRNYSGKPIFFNNVFNYVKLETISRIGIFSFILISFSLLSILFGIPTLSVRLIQPIILLPGLPIVLSALFYVRKNSYHNIFLKFSVILLSLICIKQSLNPPKEFWYNYPIFSLSPFYYL